MKCQARGKAAVRPQVILDDPFIAAQVAGTDHPQDVPALDEEQAKRTMAATTRETRLFGNHLTYTWVCRLCLVARRTLPINLDS